MDKERKRILVVEDDRQTRETLCEYLTLKGCDVRSAETVAAARHEIACGFTPDVVISDWQLRGDEDGVELIREVARFKPDSDTYVVSAYPREDLESALGDTPVSGIFDKPVSLRQLSTSIGI